MDKTGITLMAFPRGNKDPQSHPSAVIPGLIYCITLSESLTHTQTHKLLTQAIPSTSNTKNPSIFIKSSKKRRKK